MAKVYTAMNVHVPRRSHEKLLRAVTQSSPVSVKLDLTGNPVHKIFVTTGQKSDSLNGLRASNHII